MKFTTPNEVLILIVLLSLGSGSTSGQDSGSANEFWPAVKVNFELQHRLNLQVFLETENGEEFPFVQRKAGALISYRMKRILKPREDEIDNENKYNLALAVGYEFLKATQNDQTKRENRIMLQFTPRHYLGAGFLVQDRNRVEFRWVNDVYDARYRNKLTVDRTFRIGKLLLIPYAAGELFFDRNHHSWNQNQYAFGVQFPYKKSLLLDTYYLRQNCTTCSQDPLNVFGVTLNLYFRR